LGRFLPVGETDSEYAFCALLQIMESLWNKASYKMPSIQERFSAFHLFTTSLQVFGPANVIYSDSDALFIHSHKRHLSGGWGPGLYVLSRSCAISDFDEQSHLRIRVAEKEKNVFLVASVPLSSEQWLPMQTGESICVRDGQMVAGSVPR